jgi:hypothetical protein
VKFLVTGSIRSNRGPRLIVALSLLAFLLFFAAYWAREFVTIGFWPADIQAAIRGNDLDTGRGLVLMLEDLHIDLLTNAVLLMFLTSLLFQLPHSLTLKKGLTLAAFLCALAYITSRPGVLLFEPLAYVTFIAAFGSILIGIVLFAVCLHYLFAPEHDAR